MFKKLCLASALLLGTLPIAFGKENSSSAPVNINTAPVAELQTLDGVGEKRAEAIVEYRTTHGPFQTVEGLDDVPGISPGIVETNRARIQL